MTHIILVCDYLTNGFKFVAIDMIYLFSIFFGIYTIISKNPIISVLSLIVLFVSISGLLILIGLKFIGLSYILVYVGAVSILFLFILMLINIRISELISNINNDIPLAALIIMLFYFLVGQALTVNFLNKKIINKYSELGIEEIQNLKNNYINNQDVVYITSKNWDNSLVDTTHISIIGNIMYTNYAIWLIIISIILLLAMIGSIVITIKQKQ